MTFRSTGIGRRGLLCAALLSIGIVACGGGSEDAASALDVANQQLVGHWVLTEFRPDDPLEPMLATLLAAQIGNMTVTFDGQRMIAQGVGVTAERTYQVTEAHGQQISLLLTDATGVSYRVTGAFSGPDIAFASHTPPWRGQGRLRRVQ